MFSLNEDNRYFLYNQATDMRKGFDSLQGIVLENMQRSATDGSVYVFMNKSRTLIKLLHWEDGGFTLYYKRLEKGQFERPKVSNSNPSEISITWSELMLIVAGIRLASIQKSTRYSLKK